MAGKDIEASIKSEMSGDLKKSMLTIGNYWHVDSLSQISILITDKPFLRFSKAFHGFSQRKNPSKWHFVSGHIHIHLVNYIPGYNSTNFIHIQYVIVYSSPPLIRPPYLPRSCGHIREVAFGEREK